MGDEYLISEPLLAKVTGFKWDKDQNKYITNASLDYFKLVSLIFYAKNSSIYSVLMESVEEYLVNKIKDRDNIQLYSEYVMLIFDVLSCPYISNKTKKEIAKLSVIAAGGGGNNKNGINNKLIDACEKQDWFVSWKSHVDIGYLLNKKELKTPYE